MIDETVFLGRDNTIDLKLLDDSSGTLAASNLVDVTRIQLDVDGTLLDSQTDPIFFNWASGGGKLILALGQSALPEGRHVTELIVYDTANTNGIKWPVPFYLTVK